MGMPQWEGLACVHGHLLSPTSMISGASHERGDRAVAQVWDHSVYKKQLSCFPNQNIAVPLSTGNTCKILPKCLNPMCYWALEKQSAPISMGSLSRDSTTQSWKNIQERILHVCWRCTNFFPVIQQNKYLLSICIVLGILSNLEMSWGIEKVGIGYMQIPCYFL
jgi:hypothetical protein